MRRIATTITTVVLVLILTSFGIYNAFRKELPEDPVTPKIGDTREDLLNYLEASDYTYTRVVTHTEEGVRYSYNVTTPSTNYTYITDNNILSIF